MIDVLNHGCSKLPEYAQAIKNALANGYSVDPTLGVIYGLKGHPLVIKCRGAQRYPTVHLVAKSMRRRSYAVPAHKLMACAVWGDQAFAKGIHVRHGAAGVENIAISNLKLGTASENEADKSAEVRSAVGKKARACQDGLNGAKLSATQVASLRAEHAALKLLHTGKKFPNGVMIALTIKYGIGRTQITDIMKGKSWKL